MVEYEHGNARLRFTILGCASSPGVPRINGDWGNCDPAEPRNRRLRASAMLERFDPLTGGITRVVFDTGPDFRAQMVAAGAEHVDAVVYTHAHADHIHGIDDLRGFFHAQGHRIPVYADNTTLHRLRQAFGYVFETPKDSNYPPTATAFEIAAGHAFVIEGEGGSLPLMPLLQIHGDQTSLGFRCGPLAYCTDVSGFPHETAAQLHGLELLVIDALQYRPHPSHLSLAESLEWIERLAPKHAILTHMHIPLDYRTVEAETPANVEPAYDGLSIELDAEL